MASDAAGAPELKAELRETSSLRADACGRACLTGREQGSGGIEQAGPSGRGLPVAPQLPAAVTGLVARLCGAPPSTARGGEDARSAPPCPGCERCGPASACGFLPSLRD